MPNLKISGFDDLATAGITLSQVLGVAAYYDDGGTLTNVQFSGNDLGISSILSVGNTTSAGQGIVFTGDGIIQTGTTTYDAAGIIDNTIGGAFNITRVNFGDVQLTASFGNVILASNASNKIQLNTDTRLVSDLYDGSNAAGTVGQVLSSLGAGNGTEWITPSSGGGFPSTITASSATPTAAAVDTFYIITTTVGVPDIEVTLPTAVGNSGEIIGVKYAGQNSVDDTVVIKTVSSQTIDGTNRTTNGLPLASLNTYYELISDGSNWFIK